MASEDLKAERATSKLDLPQLTKIIDGGEDVTRRRQRMEALVEQDPRCDDSDRYFLSRDEALTSGFKKSVAFAHIMDDRKKKGEAVNFIDRHFLSRALNDEVPIGIHYVMFLPTIESQGSEEQKKKWLPLALDHRILGGYAQTELGHGTFIRGLETTATYDPETEEFVIHSPTLTSIKWWPGGLGHWSNHAIVVARLITQGKDHGTHTFLVQLRSMENHTPLPGITIGDIGPKFGYAANDNAFLKFDSVRIPRENMLMKHAQVKRDGTYVEPTTAKVSYGTMVLVRSGLVYYSSDMLSRACTIATRYSAVRRQSEIREGEPEVQILSFLTQQYQLLPLIATSYAFRFAGHNMMRMYVVAQAEMEEGNMDSLPELHATSAGLKAFTTEVASQGIETCRLCCGGHGYSQASGLPFIYVNFTGAQTYEGVNTVMYLQAARSLLKLFSQQKRMGSLPANVQYLASDFHLQLHSPVHTAGQWLDSHYQLEAYRQRARRLVARATSRYQSALRQGAHPGDAWNAASVDFVTAAKAHCHMTVVSYFVEALSQYSFTPENEAIMKALSDLYALHGIVENAAGFMNDGYLDSSQIELARQQIYNLLAIIRPEAVPLVDAFDHSDKMLGSVLGCYDGRVYERMYEWARKAPSNRKQVHDAYHKHLKGLLHRPKAKL